MRIVAVTVGFLFFGTNCLFAYSTESNIWAERRRAREQRSSPTLLASLPVGASTPALFSQLPPSQKLGPALSQTVARSVPKSFLKDHADLLAALSPAYGTIRKVSLSPKPSTLSPIVIHIQDVHQNFDAQKNIGQLVGSLVNAHQATLIALEGTWGDIKLQPFRDFANRKAVELSADYLLKENKISGPIHAALIGTGPLPPVIGIDDPAHYNANVDAYRQSAPHLEELKKELAAHKAILEQEKKRVFSSELKTLDDAVESYRFGRSGLGDYVQAVSHPSFNLTLPPSIQTFQKTISMERTMDFKQVENERASLINRLVEKMSRPEMDELTAQSVAYRSGEVSYANFYNYLQGVCSKAGVSLQSFLAMREYIQYVLLADGITAETLFDDLMSLERMAYSKLAKTPEAMAAVKKARSAYLTGKLVDFSLTPEEWKEYRSLSITDKSLSSFENFYREADARDHAMAENLLKAIPPGKSLPVSILVTGGYHSPGLTAQLTQAGVTVISVVPKIEKLETTQGSTYLSVFTQEKTPLDKLFTGEKLFLAQDPISKPTRKIVVPTLVVLTAFLLGQVTGLVDLNAVFHSLGGLGGLSDLTGIGAETVGTTLAVGGALFMAKVSMDKSGGLTDLLITPKVKKVGFFERSAVYLKRVFSSFVFSLSVVGEAVSAQFELTEPIIVNTLGYGGGAVILAVAVILIVLELWEVYETKRKIEDLRVKEDILNLLSLWSKYKWARGKIYLALKRISPNQTITQVGDIVETMIGAQIFKNDSDTILKFLNEINVPSHIIGMNLLRHLFVKESEPYLEIASSNDISQYKDELFSMLSSHSYDQRASAVNILLTKLSFSPFFVNLLRHSTIEADPLRNFVSHKLVNDIPRDLNRGTKLSGLVNGSDLSQKLGSPDLWQRVLKGEKAAIVELINLLPYAKWEERTTSYQPTEGIDGWGHGNEIVDVHEYDFTRELMEIIYWLGPASATEIPALCQLLNGAFSSEVHEIATLVLEDVFDSSSAISSAYSQVLVQNPQGSKVYEFAKAKLTELKGKGVELNKSTENGDVGRATSLWGVKLAEVVFGKRFGNERVGSIYKALAPAIGTGLALLTAALAWGGLALLDGSAVASVVAPLVGAVFGGVFLASHYLLPDSWLPQSHSRDDISFSKVFTMTILFATSITLSLWGIFGFEFMGLNPDLIDTFSFLSWPVALFFHGIFDGWLRLIKKLVNKLSTSLNHKTMAIGVSFASSLAFAEEMAVSQSSNDILTAILNISYEIDALLISLPLFIYAIGIGLILWEGVLRWQSFPGKETWFKVDKTLVYPPIYILLFAGTILIVPMLLLVFLVVFDMAENVTVDYSSVFKTLRWFWGGAVLALVWEKMNFLTKQVNPNQIRKAVVGVSKETISSLGSSGPKPFSALLENGSPSFIDIVIGLTVLSLAFPSAVSTLWEFVARNLHLFSGIGVIVGLGTTSPKALAITNSRGVLKSPTTRVFPGATFRLVMIPSGFRLDGESRIDFERVRNTLTVDGEPVVFTSTALDKVRGSISLETNSNVLTLLPNGNLGMNDWFVGFANNTFYHKAREDWVNRTYEMLVQPINGHPRVQSLRFNFAGGKWKAIDAETSADVTETIQYAVFGQRIVKKGKNNVENLANQFDDLRHLLRFPLFQLPNNRQLHLGFSDDRGELYLDRQKVAAAVRGEPVTLSLQPLEDHNISDSDRDRIFAEWGYILRRHETPPSDLQPGDYLVSDDGENLTVRFLPGIHPHSYVGLSQNGEMLAGFVPGTTHHEGITVNELANQMVALGAQEIFLWANGKDAKVLGPSLSGGAENARTGFLAAIVVERSTIPGPTGKEIDPHSFQEQQVSSQVNANLGARPLNQGVGEFMDRAARETVSTYILKARQDSASLESGKNIVEEGKGTPVIIVDAGSVKTLWSRMALAWRAFRTRAVIFTNDENLKLPGVATGRVRYKPTAFSVLQASPGVSLGLVSVSLVKLLDDLVEISRQGQGIHFLQTPIIELDSKDIGEEHQDIVRAAESAWILNAFFQLTLPARSLDWNGIIKTLTSIAQNA